MDNKSTPLQLLSTPISINPKGGVIGFSGFNFDLHDDATELLKRYNVSTPSNLITLILLIHSFGSDRLIPYLLAEGLRNKILNEDDLTTIYLMQDEGTRATKPILTIEELYSVYFLAFSKRNENNASDELLHGNNLSKEKLIALANQVISISLSDLGMIFKQWLYHSNDTLSLSEEFFEYWFKETGGLFNTVDGKVASLIAIAYQNKFPEKVSLDAVLDRFNKLSRSNPSSHGTYRYLSLCFFIANGDQVLIEKIVDAWVSSIIQMLYSGRSHYLSAQMSITFFLNEGSISEKMKSKGMKVIQKVADGIAKEYHAIIDIAKTAT